MDEFDLEIGQQLPGVAVAPGPPLQMSKIFFMLCCAISWSWGFTIAAAAVLLPPNLVPWTFFFLVFALMVLLIKVEAPTVHLIGNTLGRYATDVVLAPCFGSMTKSWFNFIIKDLDHEQELWVGIASMVACGTVCLFLLFGGRDECRRVVVVVGLLHLTQLPIYGILNRDNINKWLIAKERMLYLFGITATAIVNLVAISGTHHFCPCAVEQQTNLGLTTRHQSISKTMPKELLQSSLRPILVNLAHNKNLSMPLLQGLARLLELLSSWLNVALGGKLLEHLKKRLEPEKLAQNMKSWKAGEEPKIAAVIIELFHLLPHAASKFLDELVTLTIGLEGALPPGQVYGEINSPYRLPLTKFLNRYAALAVDYFLARLSDQKYFRRFMYIIRSDAGRPLRDELAISPPKILASAFPEFLPKSDVAMTPGSSTLPAALLGEEGLVAPSENSSLQSVPPSATLDAYFQGLALVKTLVKLIPSWLQNNRPVFDTLVLVWKSPMRISRLQKEQELNLVQVKESKWLAKCFLNYLRHDKTEVNVVFDILSIFLFHSRIDCTFLKEFYIIELGHDHLVVVMQMLILPMLAHAFQNGQSWVVVDPGIIKTIVDKLLDPPEEVSADYDEPLRIELLHLATLLLKYLQNDLVNHRKELIKFGWNHLKREDSASKQWAFVNVCHFLESYQAPEKIILQVFVALLRTCQPDNELLVKQALDILMPALPWRLALGARMPIWIRYTKKILVDEGCNYTDLTGQASDGFNSGSAGADPKGGGGGDRRVVGDREEIKLGYVDGGGGARICSGGRVARICSDDGQFFC
ncbi:hypothetical protein Tsubulata_032331 [Turnera subulata]|uniref:Uncharacterized protein n=1 Tax=Turnera subulata TaxID=218843 RepID=A0A9Q0FTP3_9ROSI|nr:hypothetical protein Tsubulata_032331 [Turnera subulata]